MATLPGTLVPLDVTLPLPTNGTGKDVLAWFPSSQDTFNIRVYPDGPALAPDLSPDKIRVGFHKEVAASKEMWAFMPNTVIKRHIDNSADPIWWIDLVRLPDGTASNLVFCKVDSGVVTPLYHFDTTKFWNTFNGKWIIFNWIKG